MDVVCAQIKNCCVAITGIHSEFDVNTVQIMCEMRGAQARVFALSAVTRNEGKLFFYFSLVG